mmetsp:Transcript_78440/g.127230  ORF Transcript_78440/g.127230 Transcript_78440/m.127230 type:complete len:262 (-) Transcript_78440:394-1179(-)
MPRTASSTTSTPTRGWRAHTAAVKAARSRRRSMHASRCWQRPSCASRPRMRRLRRRLTPTGGRCTTLRLPKGLQDCASLQIARRLRCWRSSKRRSRSSRKSTRQKTSLWLATLALCPETTCQSTHSLSAHTCPSKHACGNRQTADRIRKKCLPKKRLFGQTLLCEKWGCAAARGWGELDGHKVLLLMLTGGGSRQLLCGKTWQVCVNSTWFELGLGCVLFCQQHDSCSEEPQQLPLQQHGRAEVRSSYRAPLRGASLSGGE